MGIFSKILRKKTVGKQKSGMEDFMMLIRVYFQASIAADLGIANLAMLPDLRIFKTTLKVPTLNNKLGVGEKKHCKKMLQDFYGTDEAFFKEIDQSVRRNCRKIQDVQIYLVQFQSFTQGMLMLMSNMMKLKLRIPSFFKKAIYSMVETTVEEIFCKNSFTDPAIVKTVMEVRQYNKRLSFSNKWMTGFFYQIIMLAKKEPKPSDAADTVN